MSAVASAGIQSEEEQEENEALQRRDKLRLDFLKVTSRVKRRAEEIFKNQKKNASLKLKPQQLKALLAKREDRKSVEEDLSIRRFKLSVSSS